MIYQGRDPAPENLTQDSQDLHAYLRAWPKGRFHHTARAHFVALNERELEQIRAELRSGDQPGRHKSNLLRELFRRNEVAPSQATRAEYDALKTDLGERIDAWKAFEAQPR